MRPASITRPEIEPVLMSELDLGWALKMADETIKSIEELDVRHDMSEVIVVPADVVAAGVLAWARALGEFGATITFAGNVPGRTQTMPLAVFVAMETDQDAALAMSVVLILVSLTVLIALRDRWWPAR